MKKIISIENTNWIELETNYKTNSSGSPSRRDKSINLEKVTSVSTRYKQQGGVFFIYIRCGEDVSVVEYGADEHTCKADYQELREKLFQLK